jgi:hypothetical protein
MKRTTSYIVDWHSFHDLTTEQQRTFAEDFIKLTAEWPRMSAYDFFEISEVKDEAMRLLRETTFPVRDMHIYKSLFQKTWNENNQQRLQTYLRHMQSSVIDTLMDIATWLQATLQEHDLEENSWSSQNYHNDKRYLFAVQIGFAASNERAIRKASKRKTSQTTQKLKDTLELQGWKMNVYKDIIAFVDQCNEHDHEKFYRYLQWQKKRIIKELTLPEVQKLTEEIECAFPEADNISDLLAEIHELKFEHGDNL